MMAVEEEPETVDEWVLAEIQHRVEPDPDGHQNAESNVWTSKERLRDDGRKFSTRYSREEIESAVEQLVDRGEIVTWHGLLAPATPDHLRALIENEAEAGIKRATLVGYCNARLQDSGTR